MAKAAEDLPKGDFDKAIDNYRNPWKQATAQQDNRRVSTEDERLGPSRTGRPEFRLPTGCWPASAIAEPTARACP